jgi:hypothetical protein
MAGMVEAQHDIAGITSIPNGAGSGRLRPARPEEGIGLLWDAESLFLASPAFDLGLPMSLSPVALANQPSLGWMLPPAWDAFSWAPFPSMPVSRPTEHVVTHERHSAPDVTYVAAGMLPDVPSWLPPDLWEDDTDAPAGEPGLVPPRPPGLPAPLFAPPILEGGALREVSVPDGQAEAIHQPRVTDRGPEGLGWRITGGADAWLLMMDPASGLLRFLTAPDARRPADADGDNRYALVFEVRDGWGAAAIQQLTVTVEDPVWG